MSWAENFWYWMIDEAPDWVGYCFALVCAVAVVGWLGMWLAAAVAWSVWFMIAGMLITVAGIVYVYVIWLQ